MHFVKMIPMAGLLLVIPYAHAQERAAVTKKDNAKVAGYTMTTALKAEQDHVTQLKQTIIDLQKQITQVKTDITACSGTGGTVVTVTKDPDTVTVINQPATTPSSTLPTSCIFGDVLCTFYKDVTGGLPDSAGVSYWQGEIDKIQQKNPNATTAEIIAQLKVKAALTPEAVAHASTGNTDPGRGNVNTNGNGGGSGGASVSATVDAQLDSLYLNIMGRPADASGKAWYIQQISSGAMSINDVAANMAVCKANGTCK